MAGKEYTTAPILVNSDGHPIPQYLDITDTTDSPQGTFKPLTQLQAEHPDVQNVQLTGRNVEIVDLFDAYAIADTEEHTVFSWIDKYKKIYIVATNTHDSLIRLDFRFNSGSTSRYWNGSEWVRPDVQLPSSAFLSRYLVNTSLSFLDNVISDRLWVVAKANTIPSQGSLTVKLFGVIN